jgi:RNA polymerase sigma factor (sigma-70 family)
MNMDPTDTRLADLLAERAWVRSVARVLVRDETAADDLEQETWLAALEKPPTWRTSPRGWLAAVLRRRAARQARTGSRVTRRERAAARPEATASAADVVAEAEEHRRVVDAVLHLGEAQRTAVLLRFYEGLPPREIARRTDAPVETVRARIRRGLAEVRERFDREHAGDRRTWQAALVPLLSGPFLVPGSGPGVVGTAASATGTSVAGGAAHAAGVMAMTSTTTKVAVAAVALIALGWVGWTLWPAEARQGDQPRAGERAGTGPQGEGGAMLSPAPSAGRDREAAAPASTESAVVQGRSGPGVFVRARGESRPPGNVSVLVLGPDEGRWKGSGDATGFVALAGAPSVAPVLLAAANGYAPVRVENVPVAEGTHVVELSRGTVTRLTFVDQDGLPLQGDEVTRRYRTGGTPLVAEWIWPEAFAPRDMAGIFRQMADAARTSRLLSTATWEGPTLTLSDALPAQGARLLVTRPSGVSWLSGPLTSEDVGSVHVNLHAPEAASFRFVADDSGAPLANAKVTVFTEFGDDALFLPGGERLTDGDGAVTVNLPTQERGQRNPSLRFDAPAYVSWLIQVWPGPRTEVRVKRAASIEGRAWLADGKAAAGAEVVWIWRGLVQRARVADDGSYRLTGVAPWGKGPTGTAQLVLLSADTGEPVTTATVDVTPGQAARADLGTPPGVRAPARVRGRVHAGGRGLSGLFVGLTREGKSDDAKHIATTGADGRFTLVDAGPGRYRLLLGLGNLRAVDDFVLRSSDVVVVGEDDAPAFEFALPDGALVVRVLDDATGNPIPGAIALARPERASAAAGVVPGFEGRLGWSGFVDAEGRVRMEALIPGEPHEIGGYAEGYKEALVKGASPGSGESAPEVVVRLVKR